MKLFNASKGGCIIIEGPDGVGKTLLARSVQKWLVESAGVRSQVFKAPGDSTNPIGKLCRDVLLDAPVELDPYTRNMFFVADLRVLALQSVIPYVDTGSVAILDRYKWSSHVYAIYGDTLDPVLSSNLLAFVPSLAELKPVTLYLHSSFSTARDRRREKVLAGVDTNFMDRESDYYHRRIYAGFETEQDDPEAVGTMIERINADSTPDEMLNQVIKILIKRF